MKPLWASSLFWRLLAGFVLLNSVWAIVFFVSVGRHESRRGEALTLARLRDCAVVLRGQVGDLASADERGDLQPWVMRLARDFDSRLTILDERMDVLADSEEDPQAMENHADRPELRTAARRGYGTARRVSPTLNIPMLYAALKLEGEHEAVRYVRVAVPLDQVPLGSYLSLARVAGMLGLLLLGGAVYTAGIVLALRRRLTTFTGVIDAAAGGDYSRRVHVAVDDDWRGLADAHWRLNQRLSQRVDALQGEARRLMTVVDTMVDGVLAVDERQRVALANPAAANLLGFRAEHAVGRPLLESVRNHVLQQAVSDTVHGTTARRLDLELDSGNRLLSVVATPLRDESRSGVVLVLHDLTELRRLESLRQEFVANVSHELKTPLSAIKAYAETLLAGALDDPRHKREFVQRIEDQADRLHQLILDLLSLARIESGRQAFDITTVPVALVAKACLADHAPVAASKAIDLRAVAPDDPVAVRADREGFREILDNLIDNALKYTPAGGTVTLSWKREADRAVVEVEDSGIGIASHHQPRVFERFYRVDKARSRELGGTGLGLSIVKHLAQSFGGSVTVESQEGRGSRFRVVLPTA